MSVRTLFQVPASQMCQRRQGMLSPTLSLPKQAADAPVIKFPGGVDLHEDD